MAPRVPASTQRATSNMPPSKPVHYTRVPLPRPNQTAVVSRPYKCNVNGIGYEMTAYIQITQPPGTQCCVELFGGVTITNTNKYDCLLAEIEATEVDRRLEGTSKSTVPPWVRELLAKPENYQGDPEQHGGDEDEINDTQKVFQLLYGPRGRPRAHLRAAHKRQLRVPVLHYISSFIVEPEWRGKGLAKHALLAYINLLHHTIKYNHPIVLSPAPITSETEKMQKANQPIKTYAETVKSIEKAYTAADFTTIFTPHELHNGIVVMMRDNTVVPEQPSVLDAQKPANPFLKQVKSSSSKDSHQTKRKVIGPIRQVQRVERRLEQRG
ncbi:hypothetical protein PRZ48_008978 [Zasmidium cellare]|uniref:N-acetyltransferase domain-containing protein n=1 Tax=Zasmidium cellare TaxID=395010 RepID=A0ABR0EH38_ZASCE|nr:hypothetical protein PRZ48_008978 [Zasmidium cellare]